MFEIREDDLTSEQTLSLLAEHLAGMHANSPPGSVFALDLAGLQSADVTVWSAWSEGRIAAIGAVKMLPDGDAEVKSMRTSPEFIRQGAATAILATIIETAKSRGARRLCLETGSGPPFEAALNFYRRHGFGDCQAFGDYRKSGFNQFLQLKLQTGGQSQAE